MEQRFAARRRRGDSRCMSRVGDQVAEGVELIDFEAAACDETSPTVATRVRVVEVGPRDGLQNEAVQVAVADQGRADRRRLRRPASRDRGRRFVSPNWVPQMAATRRGAAPSVGRRTGSAILCWCRTSRASTRRWPRAWRDRRVRRRLRDLLAEEHQLLHRREPGPLPAGRGRCAGARPAAARLRLLRRRLPLRGRHRPGGRGAGRRALFRMGCYEVSLGDTIGIGTPRRVARMMDAVAAEVPVRALAIHAHDTYGQALANVLPASSSVSRWSTALWAGLGGCPYAPGPPATSPPRTSSTCWTAWGSPPASTSML